MLWHSAPTHEGPWWFVTPDCSTPALVLVCALRRDDDGTLRFATEHFGVEGRACDETDFRGALWCAAVAPQSSPVAAVARALRAEPLVPADRFIVPASSPGARVVRTG